MLLTAKLPAISPLQKGMKFLPVQKVQGARKIWGKFFVKNMSGGDYVQWENVLRTLDGASSQHAVGRQSTAIFAM